MPPTVFEAQTRKIPSPRATIPTDGPRSGDRTLRHAYASPSTVLVTDACIDRLREVQRTGDVCKVIVALEKRHALEPRCVAERSTLGPYGGRRRLSSPAIRTVGTPSETYAEGAKSNSSIAASSAPAGTARAFNFSHTGSFRSESTCARLYPERSTLMISTAASRSSRSSALCSLGRAPPANGRATGS